MAYEREKRKRGGTGMTTKDQERQAIEKIRKIVEELGENSYVGFLPFQPRSARACEKKSVKE